MYTCFFGVISKSQTRKFSRKFFCIAVVITAYLCPTPTFAQTNSNWNGGTGNWSTGTDWTPNGVPNNGGANTYNVTIDSGGTDTVTLDQNATINSLVLGGNTGVSTLQNLSQTVETLNISGDLTLNSGGNISGITLVAAGSGSIDGSITNGSAVTLHGNSSFGGTIDGSTLTVNGNATLGGTVSGGTLKVNGNATGAVDLEGGSLVVSGNLNGGATINGASEVSVGGTFTNGGTLAGNVFANTMINNGSIQLAFDDGPSMFAGFGTLINRGSIEIGNSANNSLSVGTSLSNYGSITILNNGSGAAGFEASGNIINFSTGTITAMNAGKVEINGNSLNNKGLIDNEGGLIQITENTTTNTGTLNGVTLAGSTLTNSKGMITGGSISENTTTNTGTLQAVMLAGNTLTNTKGMIASSTVSENSITNTGTFDGVTLAGGKVTNTNGMITGGTVLEGGVIVTGGTLSGVETPSGQTATLNGVTNSGAYVIADNSTTTLSGKITNNGTISLESTGDQTVAMIVAGGATLAGSGMLTLGTGGPNIIEGSNGKEFLTNSSTIQGAGTISNMGLINNGTILANAGTLSIGPTVQGYAFTNNGSMIVDSGSAVNISGPVKLSFQTTGTVMVSSGATLSVGGSSAFTQTKGTTTVDGNLSAANGIFISGGILDGNGGTLIGNITLAGATLSLGDGANKVGKLTLSGAYSQSSTSFLDIDLGGTKSGTFDVLNISGSATLHGTLNVDALSGFTPKVGEQFDILNYGSETGTFSTVACTFSNGDGCSVTYNGTDIVLTIAAPADPAAKTAVSGTAATRVSRNMGATSSTATHEPISILSRATCFRARLLMASAACGSETLAISVRGGGSRTTATAGIGSGSVHNNVSVATRSVSSARGGASRETSVSVAALTRFYVCAYFPSSVAHAIGCN